jgi:hypothetical protein
MERLIALILNCLLSLSARFVATYIDCNVRTRDYEYDFNETNRQFLEKFKRIRFSTLINEQN